METTNRPIIDLYNKMTGEDTENFENSLKYVKNGLLFANFLKDLSEDERFEFEIINGFDKNVEDTDISLFKKITIQLKDKTIRDTDITNRINLISQRYNYSYIECSYTSNDRTIQLSIIDNGGKIDGN